jgi:hypothetical protein
MLLFYHLAYANQNPIMNLIQSAKSSDYLPCHSQISIKSDEKTQPINIGFSVSAIANPYLP